MTPVAEAWSQAQPSALYWSSRNKFQEFLQCMQALRVFSKDLRAISMGMVIAGKYSTRQSVALGHTVTECWHS